MVGDGPVAAGPDERQPHRGERWAAGELERGRQPAGSATDDGWNAAARIAAGAVAERGAGRGGKGRLPANGAKAIAALAGQKEGKSAWPAEGAHGRRIPNPIGRKAKRKEAGRMI